MKVFICVTKDEYELPVAVADSQRELARMVGVAPSAITVGLQNLRNGQYSRYREVDIDE